MKYNIQINQLAIIENGFNIKGTNLDTWALLDFLVFFNSAKNHKTRCFVQRLDTGGNCYEADPVGRQCSAQAHGS